MVEGKQGRKEPQRSHLLCLSRVRPGRNLLWHQVCPEKGMSRTITSTNMDDPTATSDGTRPLHGQRIALHQSPRLEGLAQVLEERGAEVLRCRLVAPRAPQDAAGFEGWLAAVLSGTLEDMIWTTAEGVRETFRLAAKRGRDWDLVAALGKMRHFAAGTGTGRALRLWGLVPTATTETGDTALLLATLKRHPMIGRQVGVQTHSPTTAKSLLDFLRWMRATTVPFAPYRLASQEDVRPARELLDQILAGDVDAIAFADAEEARLLKALAARTDRTLALMQRLRRMHVVALSPRVADELAGMHIRADVVPERSFFVRPEPDEVVARLATEERN